MSTELEFLTEEEQLERVKMSPLDRFLNQYVLDEYLAPSFLDFIK